MSRRIARWLGPVLVACTPAALLWAQPAEPPRPATGFDHIGHEGQVAVAGLDEIPCARCHQLRADGVLVGRPGHGDCFGSCHGSAPPQRRGKQPYPLDPERQRVCQACHHPADLTLVEAGTPRKLAAVYPPFTIEPDYSITFSHAKHTVPARAARGCRTCHATPANPGAPSPPRPAAHTRCASCHDGAAAPAMAACRTCHLAAFGPSTSPHQATGVFPVAATFSHSAHLPRVEGKGDPCEGCHQAAAATESDIIPAPDTTACEGCHDGKRAFSTLGQDCRRCHARPSERTRRVATARRPFSHRSHTARGLSLPCAACHRGAKGTAAPRIGGHAPCSDAGCHRQEFSAANPTVCSTCHVGNEPWRALHVEVRAPVETEFGARFDHRAHLAADGGRTPRSDATCEQCHGRSSTTGRMELPADHSACGTDACHGAKATPLIGACDQCHAAGAITARREQREARRWSTRLRFDHAPHANEPDDPSTPVACQSCHAGALASSSLADMPSPSKATCVRCHDGARAFKVTGHGCQRCHH